MLRAEDNKFLTESGSGTPTGEFLRRFWLPAAARALQQGEPPSQLKHQDRYAVRSGACVTSKTKDLTAVMIERFGDPAGFVGPSRIAAAE